MYAVQKIYLHRFCEKDELEALRANFNENELFFDSKCEDLTFVSYIGYGLKITIDTIPNKSEDQQSHSLFGLNICIAPAQLLEPSTDPELLTRKDEIEEACQKLKGLLNVIEEKSGVNILSGTQLWRIDLTKSVLTQSDLHSEEIIAALKKSIVADNYCLCDPEPWDQTHNVAWTQDDAIVFQDKDQLVEGKVYNKMRDLFLNKRRDALMRLEGRGLLCFELSLRHQQLKENYTKETIANCKQLFEILLEITNDSPELFETHLSHVFYPGAMVSRMIMKELIKDEFPNKKHRLKEMLAFSDFVSGRKKNRKKGELTDAQIEKRFEKIGISPISVCREYPYIPSVTDLLNDRVNEKLLSFAEHKTTFDYWS